MESSRTPFPVSGTRVSRVVPPSFKTTMVTVSCVPFGFVRTGDGTEKKNWKKFSEKREDSLRKCHCINYLSCVLGQSYPKCSHTMFPRGF